MSVPNFIGLEEPSAQDLLRQARLDARILRGGSGAGTGTVIAQDPAAGAQVAPGSTVALMVAGAQARRSVPPWAWALGGALPIAAAAALWARGQRAKGLRPVAKASASALFLGPSEQPEASSLEGEPLRIGIEVSDPYPRVQPTAQFSQEPPDD